MATQNSQGIRRRSLACPRVVSNSNSTLKGQTRGILVKRRCLRCGQPLSVDLDHRVSELVASASAASIGTGLYRGGSRGGSLGSNEPPFLLIRLTGSLLLPAVFDTQRWHASPVWLLYNLLRAIQRACSAIFLFSSAHEREF